MGHFSIHSRFDLPGIGAYDHRIRILGFIRQSAGFLVKKRGIMQLRRVLALCIAAAVFAGTGSVFAQRNNQPQQAKRPKTEQMDVEALSSAVDFAAVGKTATDIGLTWEMSHFMKSPEGATIFPFVIDIDKATMPSTDAAVYIRLMDKAQMATLAAAVPTGDKDKKDAKNQVAPNYAWQNMYFVQIPADYKLARAIAVAPGEYDMFVAVKEKTKDEKSKEPAKIGVLHKTLVVPDFSGNLTTSDIIVAKSIEQLQQPLSAAQAAENPYVFGPLRINPIVDGKLAKAGELDLVFWIYNAGLAPATGKPDVTVEYNFYQKSAGAEKFFNKTAPALLNSTTLPAEFDFAKGHQLTEIQQVPLASFPAGDYRLEIKVTDKTNSKTVTQNVNFTVA
jgi:hypothetical protein